MKSLEEALEAWKICHDNAKDCPDCPYKDKELAIYTIDNCRDAIFHDVYNIAIELKEENEKLRYTKNMFKETTKLLSDTIEDLYINIKVLKEDIKTLREQNEQLMKQHNN